MNKIVIMEEVLDKMIKVGYSKEESYGMLKNIYKKKTQGAEFLNDLKIKSETDNMSKELFDLINCWIGNGLHTKLSYKNICY